MPDELRTRLRLLLEAQAGAAIQYRDAAARLGLGPPGAIARLTTALEALMEEDAADARPLLAALCVSRVSGRPGLGFFLKAAELGLFSGDPAGPEARHFHASQLALLRAAPPRR